MKLRKVNIVIMIACMFLLIIPMLAEYNDVAYASGFELDNGKYEIDFNINKSMGLLAFENQDNKVILEVINKKYFLTVSTDMTKVSDVKFITGYGKVGETVVIDGNIERHTYSLEKTYLGSELEFSMFVKGMNIEQNPIITLLPNTARRIGDVDLTVERPAEYVPEIETLSSDNELEKGTNYLIPEATANICGHKLTVLITAYYLNKGEKENLDVSSGFLNLNKVGEYHIIYHAESDKYKTLLGENTITELDVKIIAKVGATSIVKVSAREGILPNDYNLQSAYIKNGDIYDNAKNAMKKIADNFEVLAWNLVNKSGDSITLDENISVYLRVDDAYNKNEVKVYLLSDDGSISEVACENFGRYVKINTKDAGNYIICLPGVEFHMPMWGYALITVFGVIILIVIIVVPIVVVKKKKNKLYGLGKSETYSRK